MINNLEKFGPQENNQPSEESAGDNSVNLNLEILHKNQNGVITEAKVQKNKEKEDSNEFKDKIIDALVSDNTNRAIKLLNKSKDAEKLVNDADVQRLASEALSRKLATTGNISAALQIEKSFRLSKEIIAPSLETALANAPIHLFYLKALKIKELFGLSEEGLKNAASNQIITAVGTGNGRSTIGGLFRLKFQLTEEEFINAVKQGMLMLLSSGNYPKMVEEKKSFKISDEIFNDDKFKKAAEEGMINALSDGNMVNFSLIPTDFKNLDFIPDIKNNSKFKEAAEIGMKKCLSLGYITDMKWIMEGFDLSVEIFNQSEFKESVFDGLSTEISNGEYNNAFSTIEDFHLKNNEIAVIDELASVKIDKYGALKLIWYLADDTLPKHFPQTFNRVIAILSKELPADLDLADYFYENLDKYYGKEWAEDLIKKAAIHFSVAKKIIAHSNNSPWSNAPWAESVLDIAEDVIKKHELGGLKGPMEEDPFENLRAIRSSLGLGKILSGKVSPEESGLNLSAKTVEALKELNEIIESEHANFLRKYSLSNFVPADDRTALTNKAESKVKMNNLLPNVRNFIGRYISQMADGDPEKIYTVIQQQKNNIKEIVEEGYKRYLKIYEVDIPLYDKLYEEFDNWRESGRYPMEVYLGRDGIYAYIGRHIQDAIRKAKIGKKKVQELREKGEIVEINPKYLVYPRYFRDNLNFETKKEFLMQEQISPDADPLFYDTGFEGSIPEQIMEIMGFDKDDIDERIRLLSAPIAKRRIKGISENARQEVVEYIEHNAKTENTAIGLVYDKKTGKLRHVAEPTTPEEQFYFMMVKQAIMRHYIIKEKLNFKVPDTVNFESEGYYMRILPKYKDILPPEFIRNPKQFFEQHGTLIKGHKSEIYPDEEIISFSLSEGTEVIAKKVELRKSKESRKEFMILLAAKKAGLPTAEPIGFMSGKTQEDGSYLLMEKIEGFFGRNFEKYLRNSGKYTEEQITAVMKTITERLHELAQLFREQLNIDKHWFIKDTIIQFNEVTEDVENVIPIDWERAKIYDYNKPQKIDAIE